MSPGGLLSSEVDLAGTDPSHDLPATWLNTAVYFWRRNNWIVDPRFYAARRSSARVNRPIFLVGNQGDGLTLVCRMLRRHPNVVSISGNSSYWSGADEMHRAMVGYLPPGLTSGGRVFGGAPRHQILTPPRSWAYACDELLSGYRMTAEDANERDRNKLLTVLRYAISRHGGGEPVRFIDKSQTFTVRLGYLSSLLEDNDPFFVLVTRNPYASIYRAATGKAADMERYKGRLSLSERFELCIQHWSNSMDAVLEDGRRLPRFKVVAFERFLSEPEQSLRDLTQFLELDFNLDMVPSEGQAPPLGTRFSERWFPLRGNVNEPYLQSIPNSLLEELRVRIGPRAAQLGYEPPPAPS
jgi:hypothetical protein